MVKHEGKTVHVRVDREGPGQLVDWYTYRDGDEIPAEHVDLVNAVLEREGLRKVPAEKPKKLSKKAKEKLEDVAEDLADDGKRNYSHDPERKSPGRKKKAKKEE